VENTDDDMTITFADFGHFIGSMIPKSSTFNAHFRPQFHACQGTAGININYLWFRLEQILAVLIAAGINIIFDTKTHIFSLPIFVSHKFLLRKYF
jgi:hypothetical protein